jgi:hypothetical protein
MVEHNGNELQNLRFNSVVGAEFSEYWVRHNSAIVPINADLVVMQHTVLTTEVRNKVVIAALEDLKTQVSATVLPIPPAPTWTTSAAFAQATALVDALGSFMGTVLFGTTSASFANTLLSDGATTMTTALNTALFNLPTSVRVPLVAALRHIVTVMVLRLGMHSVPGTGDIVWDNVAHVPIAAPGTPGPSAAAAAGAASRFSLQGVFNEVRDYLDNGRHLRLTKGVTNAKRVRKFRKLQKELTTFNFCQAVLDSVLFMDNPLRGPLRGGLAGEGIEPTTSFADWADLRTRIQTTFDLAEQELKAAHRAAILDGVPSLTAFARSMPAAAETAKANFWSNSRGTDQAKELWRNIAKALEDDGTMTAGLALRGSQCLGFPYSSSWMGPMEYRVVRGSCIVRGSLNVPCHWGGFLPSGSRIGFALNPALPWELPLDTLFDTEDFRGLGFSGVDLQRVTLALKDALLLDLKANTASTIPSPCAMFQGMVAPSGRDMATHAVVAPFLLPPLFQARVSSMGPTKGLDPFAPVAGEKVFWCGTAADGPAMPQFFDVEVLRASLQEADLQLLLSPHDKNPRFVDAHKTTRFTRLMLDM